MIRVFYSDGRDGVEPGWYFIDAERTEPCGPFATYDEAVAAAREPY